jgi:hypothetical protein
MILNELIDSKGNQTYDYVFALQYLLTFLSYRCRAAANLTGKFMKALLQCTTCIVQE